MFYFWDPQQIQGKPGLTFLVRSGEKEQEKPIISFKNN